MCLIWLQVFSSSFNLWWIISLSVAYRYDRQPVYDSVWYFSVYICHIICDDRPPVCTCTCVCVGDVAWMLSPPTLVSLKGYKLSLLSSELCNKCVHLSTMKWVTFDMMRWYKQQQWVVRLAITGAKMLQASEAWDREARAGGNSKWSMTDRYEEDKWISQVFGSLLHHNTVYNTLITSAGWHAVRWD